jgi:hypothetical protein
VEIMPPRNVFGADESLLSWIGVTVLKAVVLRFVKSLETQVDD